MRIAGAKGDRGGVWFEGPLDMGMRVCLHSRVAVRVLVRLGTFDAADQQSLYAGARAIPWRDWLTATSSFAVDANIRDTPALTHSGYVALKVKDAVVDGQMLSRILLSQLKAVEPPLRERAAAE